MKASCQQHVTSKELLEYDKLPMRHFRTTLTAMRARAGNIIMAVCLGTGVEATGGANKAETDGRVITPIGKGRVMGAIIQDGEGGPLPTIRATDTMTEGGGHA